MEGRNSAVQYGLLSRGVVKAYMEEGVVWAGGLEGSGGGVVAGLE